MTTTNNLIGYDPLAWLDGEDIDEEAATPEETPAKKATKSRAKTKKVEPVEEPAVVNVAETAPESIEGEIVGEDDEIEVDISVNEDGEISISLEVSEDDEVRVEVTVENYADAETDEMEAIAQEVEAQVEEETENEEYAQEEVVAEEETENEEYAQEEVVTEEETANEAEAVAEEILEAAAEPHIDLEKDATIKNVAALYKTLKNALAAHDVIEINAADVATIDTATLQLLVSLKKDAPDLGKTVEIIYPSERFLESAKLLGLTEILGV